MGIFQETMGSKGSLAVRKISNNFKAPLSWRIKQFFRWDRIQGLMGTTLAKGISAFFGIPTITSELSAILIKANGQRIHYGVLSRRVITTAWVNFVVDQLQAETTEFGDLKFHDSGVGVTAAAIGDTDIETTDGEARVTGTQTENAANIYETVGTITYTTTKAITEHGIFTQVTGGTMADRHVFSAINVDNTDQIEFTYRMTVASGG